MNPENETNDITEMSYNSASENSINVDTVSAIISVS